MYLCMKILVDALFSSSFVGQSNICMTSNLILTEMLTITGKSVFLGISLTLFRIGYFGADHGWRKTEKTSLSLKSVTLTLQ